MSNGSVNISMGSIVLEVCNKPEIYREFVDKGFITVEALLIALARRKHVSVCKNIVEDLTREEKKQVIIRMKKWKQEVKIDDIISYIENSIRMEEIKDKGGVIPTRNFNTFREMINYCKETELGLADVYDFYIEYQDFEDSSLHEPFIELNLGDLKALVKNGEDLRRLVECQRDLEMPFRHYGGNEIDKIIKESKKYDDYLKDAVGEYAYLDLLYYLMRQRYSERVMFKLWIGLCIKLGYDLVEVIETYTPAYSVSNLTGSDIEIDYTTLVKCIGGNRVILTDQYKHVVLSLMSGNTSSEWCIWTKESKGFENILQYACVSDLVVLNKQICEYIHEGKMKSQGTGYVAILECLHVHLLSLIYNAKGLEYVLEMRCLLANVPYLKDVPLTDVWLKALDKNVSVMLDNNISIQYADKIRKYRKKIFKI